PRGRAPGAAQEPVLRRGDAQDQHQARHHRHAQVAIGAQMIRQIAAFLLLCSMAGPAAARVVTYSAKAGDTPESIAADYYGNRSLALFISEGNGLAHDARLKP